MTERSTFFAQRILVPLEPAKGELIVCRGNTFLAVWFTKCPQI